MNIESQLEQLDLSKQEAKIYLTTLKLGIAKASQIAQKANVQRGGAYYILKLLREKGFISEVIKSGVQYYSACTPEKILNIIEEERERKISVANSIIGDLKELEKTAIERPSIEIYEGYDGFKTIFSKLLEISNKELRCYLSANILEYLPHFHEQFRKRRVNKKIKIKTITQRTKSLEEIKKLDKQELRETRFNENILKNTEILQYVLDKGIIIIRANKKEQLAIYIKDESYAQLQMNIFDKNWKESEST